MNYTFKFLKVSLVVLLVLLCVVAFILSAVCAIAFLATLFSGAIPGCFGLLGFAFIAALCGFACMDAIKWMDDKFW